MNVTWSPSNGGNPEAKKCLSIFDTLYSRSWVLLINNSTMVIDKSDVVFFMGVGFGVSSSISSSSSSSPSTRPPSSSSLVVFILSNAVAIFIKSLVSAETLFNTSFIETETNRSKSFSTRVFVIGSFG